MNDQAPLVQMQGITKHFPRVLANDKVDFSVQRGEIHALLGENGAGKTTLMNILYGLLSPDSGVISLRGNRVTIHSPSDAIRLGIGMVHQHFMLVPNFSVVENVALGTRLPGYPLYDEKAARTQVEKLIDEYGFKLNPNDLIMNLSVGEQQRVEIIKALYRGADLLILDEPTSVLTPPEVEDLFVLLDNLRRAEHGIIFISHKLNETLTVSDRVTVLRQGKVVDTVNTKDTSKEDLAYMMVGRKVLFELPQTPFKGEQSVVLEVKDLSVVDKLGLEAVKDLSFQVKAGQIYGIAGVDGNGQDELVEAITGLIHIKGGHVYINGQETTHMNPYQIHSLGVAHIPADRHLRGLVMPFRIDENLVLQDVAVPPYTRRGMLRHSVILERANQLVTDYDVRPPYARQLAQQLSGGNQQKVVLARELSREPRLIIAAQPTRGLDVGATEFVHKKLIEAAGNGAAVLLVSTELEEVLSLSDVVSVIYEGKIMDQIDRTSIDLHRIGLLMGGINSD